VKHQENITERYLDSCRKEFWQAVFQLEVNYLAHHLAGSRDVLSVGCGPAILEAGLSEHGFLVTGTDSDLEALKFAPRKVRTVAARAEQMPFAASSFDAAIYVASLQFISDYHKALAESVTVLRANGKLIVMLLNTASAFIKDKLSDSHSYVQRLQHTNMSEIETAFPSAFRVQTEYLMGVKNGRLFGTADPSCALLYVITGTKVSMESKEN